MHKGIHPFLLPNSATNMAFIFLTHRSSNIYYRSQKSSKAVSNYKTVKILLLYKSRTSTKNPLLFFIGNTNLRPDLRVSSSTTSSSLQLVTMKGLIDPSLLFASFVLTSYCKGSSLSIDPSTLEFLAMIECKHLLHARNPLSKLIKGIYLSHGH